MLEQQRERAHALEQLAQRLGGEEQLGGAELAGLVERDHAAGHRLAGAREPLLERRQARRRHALGVLGGRRLGLVARRLVLERGDGAVGRLESVEQAALLGLEGRDARAALLDRLLQALEARGAVLDGVRRARCGEQRAQCDGGGDARPHDTRVRATATAAPIRPKAAPPATSAAMPWTERKRGWDQPRNSSSASPS